jgi:uncharacterized protein (TIGR00255 family)
MLLSMTGFGEARHQAEQATVEVEIRAVNNRSLRLVARIPSPYDALEPEVERLVRESVRRGSVQLTVRIDRPRRPEDYRLNLVALKSYQAQLAALQTPEDPPVDVAALLGLPGVVEDRRGAGDPHEDWPALEAALEAALGRLQESRRREGRAMADELLALGAALTAELDRVAARAPEVVGAYQARLQERIQGLLQDRAAVTPQDLIREVAILAERADVAEEITRLRAHLVQYHEVIDGAESAGRRLEFVVQEMGRETNTIGSKANDVAISRSVVEMKGVLEKIRELIQNVE